MGAKLFTYIILFHPHNKAHLFLHSTEQNKSDQVPLHLEQRRLRNFLHQGGKRIKGVVSWMSSKECFSRESENPFQNAGGSPSKKTER